MKNCRVFKSENGLELIVRHRRSAVILEASEDTVLKISERKNKYFFKFKFSEDAMLTLLDYLLEVSNKSWKNIEPKEANSLGSDYYEYYDRKLDNNGYLDISENLIKLERPSVDSNKLYQFNKRKMESFLYDNNKGE